MSPLRPLFLLIGFAAIVAQVVLMRELLALFGGAENTLGLMLAVWLLATALGSGLLGRWQPLKPRPWAAALNLLLAALFPGAILAARLWKPGLPALPGELSGPGGVLTACVTLLGPFCAVSGWLFAAASRMHAAEQNQEHGASTATVYLWEAAGSAAGGILASLLLLGWLTPLSIAFSVAWLNLAAAAWLAAGARAAGVAAVLIGPLLLWTAPRLEISSAARYWRPFDLVAAKHSIYGNLALTAREGSHTLYENGVPLFTLPDPRAAEESVHYALLQHPAPRSLLLIGGGAGGGLEEALKHPTLRSIDYVELDPAIFELLRQRLNVHAPSGVRVRHMDGRRFLKQAGASSYDVIAVNLPEPQTAQLNRFYTLEFFQEVAARLAGGGVFSFGLPSSENFISPARATLLRCLHDTLRAVFAETSFIPGSTLRFFASNQKGVLANDPAPLLDRLRERNIQTVYVSPSFLPYDYTPERVAAVSEALASAPALPLNRDFAPAAYYFGTVLWSARVAPRAAGWLQRASSAGFTPVLLWTCLPAWLLSAYLAARRRPAPAAAYAVAAMGSAVMAFQLFLLLGFQAVYGYVYSQIAVLLAAFMAGMSAGAWIGLRVAPGLRRLAGVQLLGAILLPGIFLVFEWQAAAARMPWVFTALAAAGGLVGGYQFALASRIYFHPVLGSRRAGLGYLYALDLVGACAAALLTSALLIPLFGFWPSAWLIAAVCLAPALPALAAARSAPAR